MLFATNVLFGEDTIIAWSVVKTNDPLALKPVNFVPFGIFILPSIPSVLKVTDTLAELDLALLGR